MPRAHYPNKRSYEPHETIDTFAVQSSNLASSHFLGSAPRAWMVNAGASDRDRDPRPSRPPPRSRDSASKAQVPQSDDTFLIQHPDPDDESTIEVVSRPRITRVLSNDFLPPRPTSGPNVAEASIDAGTTHRVENMSPKVGSCVQPSESSIPHPSTLAGRPGLSTGPPSDEILTQTITTNLPREDAHQTLLAQVESTKDPGGGSLDSNATNEPTQPMSLDTPKERVEVNRTPVAAKSIATESHNLATEHSDVTQKTSPHAAEVFATQPNASSNVHVNSDTAVNGIHITSPRRPSSVTVPIQANTVNVDRSRNRPIAMKLSDERRTWLRTGADPFGIPKQLPTPQNSPVSSSGASLRQHFEAALAAAFAGGERTPDQLPVIDEPRIEMMRSACSRDDWVYLLTHAIYCCWSASQWAILDAFRFNESHVHGFNLLHEALGSNRKLSKQLQACFINFPQPPERLVLDQSDGFQALLEEVRCFIFHLGSAFAPLRTACLSRRCPPCPAEFKYALKLTSPTMHQALFLHVVGPGCDDLGWLEIALNLFHKEMDNPRGSAISVADLNFYHGAQLTEIIDRWGRMYAQELQRFFSWKAARRPAMPSGARQPSGTPSGPDQSLQGPRAQIYQPFDSGPQISPSALHFNFYPSQQTVHPGLHPQNGPGPSDRAQSSVSPASPQTSRSPWHTQVQHTPTLEQYPPNSAFAGPLYSPGGSRPIPSFQPHLQQQIAVSSPTFPTQHPQAALTQIDSTNLSHGYLPQTVQQEHQPSTNGHHPEAILGDRTRDGNAEYLTRWKGSGPQNGSWVPASHFRNAQQASAPFPMQVAVPQPDGSHSLGCLGLVTPASSMGPIQQGFVLAHTGPSTVVQQTNTAERQVLTNAPDQSPNQAPKRRRRTEVPERGKHRRAQAPPLPNLPGPLMAPGAPRSSIESVPLNASQQPIAQVQPLINGASDTAAQMSPSERIRQTATPIQDQSRQNSVSERSQSQQSTIRQRRGDAFFHPNPNFVLPYIAAPEPDRLALHQVQLRSPEYHKLGLDGKVSDARFYQYVENIIELPPIISKDSDLIRWNLSISSDLAIRKAITLPPVGEFSTKQRNVLDGDVQFRLKSVVFSAKDRPPCLTLAAFCNQPTKWPKCLAVSVNNHTGIDFRRKAHYGTDIPTDLTDLLHEGDNEIVIGAIFTPQEFPLEFLMAVEIICVADHKRLLEMPPRIPATEALSTITTSLKTQVVSDDDDLIVSQPFISIDLVDPFMSVIWSTPVRGVDCKHRECFDLEAFLLSRTSRSKEGGLSSPDKWKCPICKNDCRPPSLVIDEFLLSVRKELEQDDKLHAKAILVKEDGSWQPKFDEKGSDDDDRDTPDPGTPAPKPENPNITTTPPPTAVSAVTLPQPTVSAPPEQVNDQRTIIILDDD